MKALLLGILAGCAIVGCTSDGKPAEQQHDSLETEASVTAEFESIVDSIYQANPDAIGIIASIENPNGKVRWNYAVGVADTVTQDALLPNQPVLIASMTKTYVAATIYKMIQSDAYDITLESQVMSLLSPNVSRMLVGVPNSWEMKIKHLLSHTSGLNDYAEHAKFLDKVRSNPSYRWDREEQLFIATNDNRAVGSPGETFFYSDANYLVLTDMIEQLTGKPYYEAMREILGYEANQLKHTWFATQERVPQGIPARSHQYFSSFGMDTYRLDVSFDLYGGGGIAATMKDVSCFVQQLFDRNSEEGNHQLTFMAQAPKTNDLEPSNYALGLEKSTVAGMESYGHGGFWGTVVMFVPELNATISIAVLEKDRSDLRQVLLDELGESMKKN